MEENIQLPQEKKRTSARDFFLYILSMVTLYWSAISFLTIVFQLINTWVPDMLDTAYYSLKPALRFGISSLFVTFPVYCAATWYLNKDMRVHPEKRSLWVRRWLVYFTLFVASLIIIGDSVSLLNNFLGGELQLRFIMKSLSILVVTAVIFGYYIRTIRNDDKDTTSVTSRGMKYFIVSVVSVVVVVIVAGIVVIGSPIEERKSRFDEQRVNDLSLIQSQIIMYWQNKGILPGRLGDLSDPVVGFTVPHDPETLQQYIYRTTVIDKTFQLCAVFSLPSGRSYTISKPVPAPYPMGKFEGSWDHGQGEQCFDRTIDPDFFPPQKDSQKK